MPVSIRPAFVRARGNLLVALWHGLLPLPRRSAHLGGIRLDHGRRVPTYSFTGTKDTVETLERQTGPVDLVLYGPRRLGEVLQWPGMVGAAGGIVLGLALLRRRSEIGVAAAVLALGAFAILAVSGLAIIPRYTMLAAAVLAVFAALGLLGWRLLEPGHRWRRPWQAFAALVALMFVVWGAEPVRPPAPGRHRPHQPERDRVRPQRPRRLRRVRAPLPADLGPQPPRGAAPRLRPRGPAEPDRQRIRAAPAPARLLPQPASPFVIHNFILDPNDPTRFTSTRPPGFREVGRNESWVLYRRC